LYIYGGVGMGKTHLLNAIGLKLKEKNKVMFISAERFMYQFVKAIKSNEMVKFKEYFRNTDILLIDDIQFMNGKEAMQEEFFHTFNALIDKGSQVIISSDRAPNKLARIQERIKSRFSGGLVVDIQKPDFDLRRKIVKKKVEELNIFYSNQINIPEEIQQFISSEITTSIRELVGAINRIVSFSRIYNKVPNLSEIKVVLKIC
jgi:chromosomal replication initiator protein